MPINYRTPMYAGLSAVGYQAGKDAYSLVKSGASRLGRGGKRYAQKQSKSWIDRRAGLARARNNLDYPLNAYSYARRHVAVKDSAIASRVLQQEDLLDISRTGSSHALNSRDRDIIRISGFKIQCNFRNLQTRNMYANWAVIALRGISTAAEANFFRGDGATDRAADFGTGRSGLENFTMSINSDDYIVLARGKKKVATAASTEGADSWVVESWVPCKTVVRYTSGGDPHQNIAFVYWVDFDDADRSSASVATSADIQFRLETYFHNIT